VRQRVRPAWGTPRAWCAARAAASLLLACSSLPTPCRSADACDRSQECLANRCVAVGAQPVTLGAARLVVDPDAVAVVRRAAGVGLPSTVTLGGPSAQNEQLLLRFPLAWADLDVDAAFLLLKAAPDADPTLADVPVEVALAARTWASGSLREGPRTRAPSSMGLARTRPPALLRVDVTAIVRALTVPAALERGLVVRAAATEQRGATYLTGTAGGTPQLEIYGRATRRSP
jgi:hypothetical protein